MATQPITSETDREAVATMPAAPAPTTADRSPNGKIPVPPPVPMLSGVNDNGAATAAASSTAAPAASPPDVKAEPKPADSIAAGEREPVEPLAGEPGLFSGVYAAARQFWRGVPSWLASLLIHVAMFVALGLFYFEPPAKTEVTVVSNSDEQQSEGLSESLDGADTSLTNEGSALTNDMVGTFEETKIGNLDNGPIVDVPLNVFANDTNAPDGGGVDLTAISNSLSGPQQSSLKTIGVPGGTGQGLGGRSGSLKGELLKRGGSDASEAAVARGLKWLAKHQLSDGGWNFDLEKCPNCKGLCADSGDAPEARLAATALGLLPFLGAGQTHREGQYKEVVRKGLYYLTSHTKNVGGFLSMHEPKGRMYSHGLCTIALCEAYAMTGDNNVKEYAQSAINFIVYAQDPVGGGWRYEPREDGDTSVVGWQIMALKSAQMAGLEVPNSVYKRATKFLDSVQSDDGSTYGYIAPSAGFPRATSSVGLLCRMYMGWKKDNAALKRGVTKISREGPSIPARTNNTADMYYNYYATQVLRHWGGHEFDEWNLRTREWLIESQAKEKHEAGSWYFSFANHASVGGRLYCTAMATMMLEVYYRHLPIYGGKAVNDEFSRIE
jgi:hypothetical protein